MKVDQLLEKRRAQWIELETLCQVMAGSRRAAPDQVVRFAALYRAACADLALADAYQLPPATVEYLHQLVGRAHNQLYRSRPLQFRTWMHELLVVVPQRLRADRFLRLAMVIFWGIFLLAGWLAYRDREFAAHLIPNEMQDQLEEHFAKPADGRPADLSSAMAGFYIWNNTSIGLRCFAFGLAFGIGGLLTTVFNAALLGCVFGYMATSPNAENFFLFVVAHGPFELTAIVLSAAAGMRLGFALIDPQGMARSAALRRAACECMPVMAAAMILFLLAALVEGFLSPSAAPAWVKVLTAVVSAVMLVLYYAALGQGRPGGPRRATG